VTWLAHCRQGNASASKLDTRHIQHQRDDDNRGNDQNLFQEIKEKVDFKPLFFLIPRKEN
jgi:hypothetical protein